MARCTGDKDELLELAKNALAVGHSFIIMLGDGFYPTNVLNMIKMVPGVCHIFCAAANPIEVLIAETSQGRGIIRVVDGFSPIGVEDKTGVAWCEGLLHQIGYKS